VRIPWGGIAALIAQSQDNTQAATRVQPVAGKAFCTLPLPLTTHIPVHVNATFALTDTRRDLWLGEGCFSLSS
jgi:hypothetical protein